MLQKTEGVSVIQASFRALMGLGFLVLLLAGQAHAGATAYETVQKTTDRVLQEVQQAQGYFEQDPERFYAVIETLMDEVVDFNSFARGVMGQYASRARYDALPNDDAKAAFREQVARFSAVFRQGLVRTYAKGLLNFAGQRIEVVEPPAGVESRDSVTIEQHIYGSGEQPYVIFYKLRQDRDGQWKVRNVTIESINLGVVYRNQFDAAMRQYNGDLVQVIDNWSVEPQLDQPPSAEAS